MEQIVQKKRVAVYCRVSAGSEDPSASREVQETRYTQKISEEPDWELAGFYADQGIGSGSKSLPEFNRMIADCKRGRIDIIMVKSVSRFARGLDKCIETVRMLKASGIGVIFEREGIDTLTESGDIQLAIFSEFAKRECEAIMQYTGHSRILPCRYGIHVLGRN